MRMQWPVSLNHNPTQIPKHTMNKNEPRDMQQAKTSGPHPYQVIKSAEMGRNSLPQEGACCLGIQS